LLEYAINNYPEADAVIDITTDFVGITAIFYAQRKNIVTGLVVEYITVE
jgi:hypothetical protein